MEYIGWAWMDSSYREDIIRIQRVLLKHGWESTYKECSDLWENHSADVRAGWLLLPKSDEELWNELETLIK